MHNVAQSFGWVASDPIYVHRLRTSLWSRRPSNSIITKSDEETGCLGVPPIVLRWIHSPKTVGNVSRLATRFPIGVSPNWGMPQGTHLGPYVFLSIIIDDQKSLLKLLKLIDDCTDRDHWELNTSRMQLEIDSVVQSTNSLLNWFFPVCLYQTSTLLSIHDHIIKAISHQKVTYLTLLDLLLISFYSYSKYNQTQHINFSRERKTNRVA